MEYRVYTAFEADGKLYQYWRLRLGVTNGISIFHRIDSIISQTFLRRIYAHLGKIAMGRRKTDHDQNLKLSGRHVAVKLDFEGSKVCCGGPANWYSRVPGCTLFSAVVLNQWSLWGTQLRRTSRPFAQRSLILAHFQHSKFNTVYISRNPFNNWNASLVVRLHGCAVAFASCATKQTFAQCRIFLERTLFLTFFKCLTLSSNKVTRFTPCTPNGADLLKIRN